MTEKSSISDRVPGGVRIGIKELAVIVTVLTLAGSIVFYAGKREERLENAPMREAEWRTILKARDDNVDRRITSLENRLEDLTRATSDRLFTIQGDVATIKGILQASQPKEPMRRTDAGREPINR